jgi:hypothetical protein
MRVPDHPTLLDRMIQHRLKQLVTRTPVLAATLASYTHRCGRAGCHCRHGGPLHAGQHLTFKERGKTRSVYVPKDLIPQVQAWIAEHKRLKQLLKELQQLTVALVRTHAAHRRRKKGRP